MFGNRLKEERLKKQLSQEDLAEHLNVKKNTVWNWENEKSYPNAAQLIKIMKLGLDIQYVLTGSTNVAIKNNLDENKRNGSNIKDFAYVPDYDVLVSAGFGTDGQGTTAPSGHRAFPKDWLLQHGLKEKNLNVVTAYGDSMVPTINDKDSLLVDTSRNIPYDGRIYVIRSGDTLWVKRIQKKLDGSLLLISDNPSYPPMNLELDSLDDVQIIGQVINVSKDFI